MPSTFTPNKLYELQATGENAGLWGQNVNDNVTGKIDNNLAGVVAKSLSNANVTLTATDAQMCMLRLTGMLTANVVVNTPALGFYLVENLTTGNFSVTLDNGGASSPAVPQPYRGVVFSDPSRGVVLAGLAHSTEPDPVPPGAEMLFVQGAVPSGWTLKVTWNDMLLKVTSGTGGVQSGTLSATTVFALTATGGHTLTQANLAAHSHTMTLDSQTNAGAHIAKGWASKDFNPTGSTPAIGTSAVGGGGSHAHNIDLRARRLTTIVGIKA